jgi:RHS repeat-associated protein
MKIIRQLSFSLAWLAAFFLSMSVTAQTVPSGTITYIHNDLLGSPAAATNAAGVVIWREAYSGYGERLKNESAGAGNKVWYTSRHQDEDTGLVYMGARYYDPAIGRFLSLDSVGFSEGNVHSFNRYSYANNNPYKFKDPDGRDAVIIMKPDGSVNIKVPIIFSGPGATSAAVAAIKQDISSAWSGSYNINNNSTSVNVEVVDGAFRGKVNSITLTTGPTSNTDAQGASFVRGGNSGEWNINSPGMSQNEAAHEAGHLMGEGDYYTSNRNSAGTRITAPANGYTGNLMGQLPGVTNSANMQKIMDSARNLRVTER